MSTSIDFYLNEEFFSTATGLTAGSVTSGVTEDTEEYDCKSECTISLAVAQSLFQFKTDSLDMTDVASDDVLYKLEYTSPTPLSPLSADFISNTLMTLNGINIDNELKNMSIGDLNDLLNQVLENEDYIKAIEIRDELKKRKGKQ